MRKLLGPELGPRRLLNTLRIVTVMSTRRVASRNAHLYLLSHHELAVGRDGNKGARGGGRESLKYITDRNVDNHRGDLAAFGDDQKGLRLRGGRRGRVAWFGYNSEACSHRSRASKASLAALEVESMSTRAPAVQNTVGVEAVVVARRVAGRVATAVLGEPEGVGQGDEVGEARVAVVLAMHLYCGAVEHVMTSTQTSLVGTNVVVTEESSVAYPGSVARAIGVEASKQESPSEHSQLPCYST
ncbi:hypothetical protein FIBSPDRAFT_904244 [Athelia psychrophila]|uniref:Uncharacterized protein n=1 Tax=Athelia psychrophila TaxID=1759441 RepID=A0A167UZS5_9AGAM|nr:hypothetical protein FIBSPDRAFT_904244 [Fibularhizoctonia sp. CBS 109695]